MFNARIVLRTNKFNFNYGTLKAGVATQTRLTEKDVEEVRIPVPWGHIAGKNFFSYINHKLHHTLFT